MTTPSEKVLVSIVLPTYNRAHLLPYAIRSVLNQSHTNLELIVVDDHSSDTTPDVVAEFDDPRIRYFRNDPNLRLPRSLNRGFSQASGDYLTWTSDDNLFLPTAIARMVEMLTHRACDFVYADYYQFSNLTEDGRPTETELRRLPDKLQLGKGNHIGACFLYTRAVYDTIGEYDPELFLVEDYDYWMRAAKQFSFCHLAEPLYYFRRDENTLFWSRFGEVKSADILARYKNGFASSDQVTEAMVKLALADPSNLNHFLLRISYAVVRKRSWRLTQLYRRLASRYLRQRLRKPIDSLLNRYSQGEVSFGDSKDALSARLQRLANIQYFEPNKLEP